MIDYDKLKEAFDADSIYALQLEVGDTCNQGCIYCEILNSSGGNKKVVPHPLGGKVSDKKCSLSDDTILAILNDSKKLGITAIEWLGSEPLLRESILDLMEHASALGLRNNIWSCGLPFGDDDIARRTVQVAQDGLIAVHVSTVDRRTYKMFHPNRPETDLDLILDGLRTLIDFRYPTSQMINTATLTALQSPEDMIHTIDFFEEEFHMKTSLNIFRTNEQSGMSANEQAKFIPDDSAVRKVCERIGEQWKDDEHQTAQMYCSASAAILCDGSVTPYVSIRDSKLNISRDGSWHDIATRNIDYLTFKSYKTASNLSEAYRKCSTSTHICDYHLPVYALSIFQ